MTQKKIKIINIVGARPNFMKIAPIIRAMNQHPDAIEHKLVHTGQHYDEAMSKLFFDELEIPKPDVNLEVGSGSHAQQTAEIMKRFEPIVEEYKPDYVLVVGDVNSTIACGLVAKKMGVKLIHVEAGLRSYDMEMPEEINRILTDRISDLLFITEAEARDTLLREGTSEERIFFTGNVMIDTLLANKEKADATHAYEQLGLSKKGYYVVTLHRPSNVDDPANLQKILEILQEISTMRPVVFPVHPRTKSKMESFDFMGRLGNNMHLLPPLGYLEFLNLMANAMGVLTDSGGIQEETTILEVPCLTLRENTERPITLTQGTNTLTGLDREKILATIQQINQGAYTKTGRPEHWDGKAAERIVDVILEQHV